MKRWKRPTDEDMAERQRIRAIREAHYARAAAFVPEAAATEISLTKPQATVSIEPETIVPLARDDGGRRGVSEPREQQVAVHIPDDWESLPYLPRSAGEPCLRALASQVSSTPILNKALAIEAIEAELARRDG